MVFSRPKEMIIVTDNTDLKKLGSDSEISLKIISTKDAEKSFRNGYYSDSKFTILHLQKNSVFDLKKN